MEVALPWIKIVTLALAPCLMVGFAFQIRRKSPRWIVPSVRAVSVIAAVPLCLFSLFLLTAQGCEEDRKLVGSPDGKHVARLMIYGNVPAGTSLRVIERKSWSAKWQEVSGAGTIGTLLEPIEPRIVWSDNSHLVLDYPATTEGTSFTCDSRQVEDVWIVCKAHETRIERITANR